SVFSKMVLHLNAVKDSKCH
uniref:Uncharacterized protein n=1 Tax=Amphimedon queenslandica TaxID=400682 RepID=A0A1X7UY32_AMPQE